MESKTDSFINSLDVSSPEESSADTESDLIRVFELHPFNILGLNIDRVVLISYVFGILMWVIIGIYSGIAGSDCIKIRVFFYAVILFFVLQMFMVRKEGITHIYFENQLITQVQQLGMVLLGATMTLTVFFDKIKFLEKNHPTYRMLMITNVLLLSTLVWISVESKAWKYRLTRRVYIIFYNLSVFCVMSIFLTGILCKSKTATETATKPKVQTTLFEFS